MAGAAAAAALPANTPESASTSTKSLTCATTNTSSLAVVRRVALSVVGVIVVAGVVWAIATRGGDEKSGGKTAIGTTTQPRKEPRKPKSQAKPKRQGVKKGHGTQPDRPAKGTGALLAIADQKPETFSDPLFRRLGVARSRLNTPWNSIFTEPDRVGAWLKAAQAAGVEPLI